MKFTLAAAGVAALVLALATVTHVHAQATGCAVSTLQGPYVFLTQGVLSDSGFSLAFAGNGRIVADGNGNFTGSETASYGGTIVSGTQLVGTYQLNADCTGTIQFTAPALGSQATSNLYFATSANGAAITFLQTDAGTVVMGSAFHQ